MQPIVGEIHKSLLKNHKTVAVAESCTGGLTSAMLTELPGSSAFFLLGAITYSNAAKERVLKVPSVIIKENGAVSKIVAVSMAGSVRKIVGADFGIGITGIAGPGGGTPLKPVGTVYIACSDKNKTICKKFIFKGSRGRIRAQAALKALQLLKTML
ncbi:MAG: CinA family protein [Candidatus Omnitrophica bacterium]|nr:CinA family protein [Candidatus Omnitrophota bacterium]